MEYICFIFVPRERKGGAFMETNVEQEAQVAKKLKFIGNNYRVGAHMLIVFFDWLLCVCVCTVIEYDS